MMASVITILGAFAATITALALWRKVKPEVRALNVRTEAEQSKMEAERYERDERRRTETREAEERVTDKLGAIVSTIGEQYQTLLTTVNAANERVVEGMRAELEDVRRRLVTVEETLQAERNTTSILNETIAGLNASITELNKVVGQRDATIRRIREKLNDHDGIDTEAIVSDSVAPERRTH